MKHQARKRFGQNFLCDQGIIDQIVDAIAPKKKDHIVEIGPGLGALTHEILPTVKKFDAIELDRDLITQLTPFFDAHKAADLHSADALNFPFDSLASSQKLRIIGNLPYNISSPLIMHLLKFSESIEDMHFMLQKEMVDRICAKPNTKAFGRLSVMVQYFCKAEKCFEVPPTAFDPEPKVTSAIVRLTLHKQILSPVKDLKHFESVIKQAFSQRRKTLRNTLKTMISAEQLTALDIDPTTRAETLRVEDYVKISNLELSY